MKIGPSDGSGKSASAPRSDNRRLLWLVTALALVAAASWVATRRFSHDSATSLIDEAAAVLRNDPAKAERLLRTAVEQGAGDSVRIVSLMCEALARQQRWPEVVHVAQEWVALAPNDPAPRRVLSDAYAAQKQLLPAAEACREAISLTDDPQERIALRRDLLDSLIQLGDAAAARQEAEILRSAGVANPLSSLQNAVLLRLEGRLDEALQAVGQDAADSPAALMLRGVLLLDLRRHKEAAADLSRVVAVQPDNKEAHYKLATALRLLGEEKRAAEHFEISRRLVEHRAAIVSLQAQLAARPDDVELARRLRQLIESTPANK